MKIQDSYLKVWLMAALLALPFLSHSQIINKIYPATWDRTSRDIIRTSDGGYLIVGVSNNSNPFDSDLYVIKTNSTGDMVWDTLYGGAKPEYAYSMVEAHDGNFIVVGFTQSYGGGDYDMYFLKITANGKYIKHIDYGGSGNEEARQIIKTQDNKYVVVGTKGLGTANSQIVVVKMDENLENRQEWEFGGTGHDYGLAIQQTASGDYIVGGQTWSKGAGGGDAYAIRLKNDMSMDWDKTYGGALNEEVVGLVVNGDGSSILAVRDSIANEPVDGNIDIRMIKINSSDGSVAYQAIVGGAYKDTPKTIAALGPGEYIVGAISRSFNWGSPQMWLMKWKDNGTSLDTVWTRNYGALPDHDHCHLAKPSHDGGILAIGHSRTNVMRVWFMKLNEEGRLVVGVNENEIAAGVNVYPNPSSGIINISADRQISFRVIATDLLGNLVYESNEPARDSEGVISVDLSGKTPGLYLLSLQSVNGNVTKKVMIE